MGKSSGGGVVGVIVALVAIAGMTGHLGSMPDRDLDLPSVDQLSPTPSTSGPAPTSRPAPKAAPSEVPLWDAQRQLSALTVTKARPPEPKPGDGYDRDAYGEPWYDVDQNGCDTRQDVLYAWVDRGKPYQARQQRRCGHSMVSGTWVDPYTGIARTFSNLKAPDQAQSWQIDHRVPIREADFSGARAWPAGRKLAFANDPINLVPTDGPANASKRHHDPAAWKPRGPFQCDYAKRYIAVKSKYQLTVDRSEKNALKGMLDRC